MQRLGGFPGGQISGEVVRRLFFQPLHEERSLMPEDEVQENAQYPPDSPEPEEPAPTDPAQPDVAEQRDVPF